MENFNSVFHHDLSNKIRELWIDTGLSKSELLALKRASFEEDFELVGISDEKKAITKEIYDELENWGYEIPVASKIEGLDDIIDVNTPEDLIGMAAKDCGGMDILLWDVPYNFRDAIEKREELKDNIDGVYISLGSILEYAEDFLVTTKTHSAPDVYRDIFEYGKQKFILDPKVVQNIEPIKEIEEAFESKKFFKNMDEKLSYEAILNLYLYVEPQAFVLEEHSMHIHTEEGEKGLIHFGEGNDVLLATAVNQESFNEWVKKYF